MWPRSIGNVRLNVQLLAQLVSVNSTLFGYALTLYPRCSTMKCGSLQETAEHKVCVYFVTSQFVFIRKLVFVVPVCIINRQDGETRQCMSSFWRGCRVANHSKQFTDGLQIDCIVGDWGLGKRLISLMNHWRDLEREVMRRTKDPIG